jgi:hypothetical protein
MNPGPRIFFLTNFGLSINEIIWKEEHDGFFGEYEDTTSEKGRPGDHY